MKKVAIAWLVLMAACTKTEVDSNTPQPVITTAKMDPEACKFGITQFNLSKRAFLQEPISEIARPPKNGGGTTTTPLPVILLDMDGHTVSGTSWNVSGNIVCAPANLTAAAINTIIQRVTNDFSPFNVVVTTSETTYNNAPINKRMRVIVTETWEWYGQAGGTAFVNSFTWGDNTPCFVFSSLLNYNTKNIAEACSHETGHTLGLYHQSRYDLNCIKTSEYHSGAGSGETGWAPIMGVGYYQNMTLWSNGPNSYGCTNFQDEVTSIKNVVGFKTDDYSNTITNAPTLTTVLNGVINNNTDIDFFKISFTGTKTISLIPGNVGTGNLGGNLDLILTIYNSQGSLISSINNTAALDAITTLSGGTYYVSASTVNNAYASTYGMLGEYKISLY